VEIRSWMPSSSGPLQRVTTIDARRAIVVGQYVYDQSGKTLLASAVAETHQYLPEQQISLPQTVAIQLPPANMALKINLGMVQVNQLSASPAQLWTMPTFDGAPQYDLGGAAVGAPLPGHVSSQPLLNGVLPTSYPVTPSTGYAVTPASLPSAPPTINSQNAAVGALPVYGQRAMQTPPATRRY
jgi:hypothetical protein